LAISKRLHNIVTCEWASSDNASRYVAAFHRRDTLPRQLRITADIDNLIKAGERIGALTEYGVINQARAEVGQPGERV
jgi:hypothetical protein